jgi:hypothetical protein
VAPGVVEEQLENAALPAPTLLDPERDAAFLRGDYVGNVRFGGGVIRTGEVALNARARLLEFNQQDVDAAQGVAWLHDAVADALTARTVAYTPSTAPVQPTVERIPVRGMHPDDGTDNQNIPRSELRPGAIPADPAAPTRYVLVPMLRQYYTHNGGWFIGQQYGCMAGARVEALVVLYDTHTGAPVWWMDAVGRHIDGDTATPSSAQLDQYLLWAEDDVELALAKELLP